MRNRIKVILGVWKATCGGKIQVLEGFSQRITERNASESDSNFFLRYIILSAESFSERIGRVKGEIYR